MKKPPRPIKPFKGAYWNARLKRWEGWKKEDGTFHKVEPKNHRPLKPFKTAVWNAALRRWEGKPLPKKKIIPPFIEYYRATVEPTAFNGFTVNPKKKSAVKIRPKSKKMTTARKEYLRLRDEYLSKNPACGAAILGHAGTFKKATEVHHIRGRVGPLLCDTKYWLPVCSCCHAYIHNNVKEAYSLGFLASRDSKSIKLQTTQ